MFSDTVGFKSDLPMQLVAAFRATLEEVTNADIVVHARDLTHPEFYSQALTVNEILKELDVDPANSQKFVQAWNKVDLLLASDRKDMLTRNGCSQSHIPISATFGDGLNDLPQKVDGLLRALPCTHNFSLYMASPFCRSRRHARAAPDSSNP